MPSADRESPLPPGERPSAAAAARSARALEVGVAERSGVVAIARYVKEDGRALILYARESDGAA